MSLTFEKTDSVASAPRRTDYRSKLEGVAHRLAIAASFVMVAVVVAIL